MEIRECLAGNRWSTANLFWTLILSIVYIFKYVRLVSSTPSRLPRTVFCPQQSQQNPCGAKPQSTFLKLWDMTKHHIMRSCINQAECSRMLSCTTECFPRGEMSPPKMPFWPQENPSNGWHWENFQRPKVQCRIISTPYITYISSSKIPGFSWLLPTHKQFIPKPPHHAGIGPSVRGD